MKKINKLFKFSSSIIMCALIFLSGLISVKAISAPDSMIVDNYEAGYANNPLNINRSFQVKQASDGKYVYCMAYNLLVPENTKYVNKGVTNDAGVSYIIKKGANDKSLNEYFVTQVSLWIYLLDNNLMQDSSAGSIKAYRSTVYSSSYDNNTLAKEIRQTVADAKKATKDSGASLNVSNTVAITKENNNYVTSVIYVNTSASDYQVKLENAPLNASYEKVNNGFIVKVPTSSVSSDVSFKAVVSVSDEVVDAYIYNATNSSYQPIVAPFTKKVNLEDEITLSISPIKEQTPPPEEKPVVSIIKKDKDTNKTLEGATLVLLDSIDEQSSSGKLDLIIQLPYVIKSQSRKDQAEQRRKDIENQLKNSKYGIAYTDGTEKITQLNRPLENNLMKQVEYLTSMLYGQLGITQGVMDGTADEKTMTNYYSRTIEPIAEAIALEMNRKFLTKTARSQKQQILYFRDPFKLVPVNEIAEIADKFTRNEILSSNEVRQVIGRKPSDDPKADQLVNANINQKSGSTPTAKVDNKDNNSSISPPSNGDYENKL